MMYIAICDDEKLYREVLKESVEKWANNTSVNNDVMVFCFHSSEDLCESIQSGIAFDLVFLDISIPGELNGIELAKIIRKTNTEMIIVFVTNYSDYVYDGYMVDALRYLRKPINPSQIYECLDIAYQRTRLSKGRSLSLKSNRQTFIIPFRDILMIEIKGHNLLVRTTKDKNNIVFRVRLGEIIEQLPPTLFVQCHRSYVVNLMYVRKFSRTSLYLADSTQVPISKTYFEFFEESFEAYFQGV